MQMEAMAAADPLAKITDAGLRSILSATKKTMTQKQKQENGQTNQQTIGSPSLGTDIQTNIQAQQKKIAELESAGIHRRYWWVTFDAIEKRGLPDDEDIQFNFQRAKGYAEHLNEYVPPRFHIGCLNQFNPKYGRGITMMGQYGTMKTTMAVAILRHWLENGHNGLLVSMPTLIDNLYSMYESNRAEAVRYEKRLRDTQLLIIDDLGGENTDASWIRSKVDSIISERYDKQLPIIASTNLNQREIGGTYGGRIMDRLKNTNIKFVFRGKSQREAMT